MKQIIISCSFLWILGVGSLYIARQLVPLNVVIGIVLVASLIKLSSFVDERWMLNWIIWGNEVPQHDKYLPFQINI